MGIRQFDAITPAEAERSSTHPAGTPAPPVTQPAGQGLSPAGIPALGGTAGPRTEARALVLAGGGRLARAGAALLQLQRRHGNQYVQRVVERASQQSATAAPVIQTKLMLGTAGDRYEREADRVAEEVVRARSRGSAGQHASSPRLATQRLASAQGGAISPEIQNGIQQVRAGGQIISEHARAPMERALGADLGRVRLHTGDAADWLSRALGARAFTTGQDIFFRRGEYRPGSFSTRKLLAHELAHVVQQNPSAAGGDAAYGGHVQGSKAARGGVVQCMFPAAPHAGNLAEINRVENKPATTLHRHQGVTSQPRDYFAPVYSIDVEKKGNNDYIAEVKKIGGGYIGDCEATYLGAGAYDTGFLWAIDPLYAGSAPTNRMLLPHGELGNPPAFEHVIENVSANIARGSKAAEQEHLNDYRSAYDLTLGAAEGAIDAVAGTPFQGTTRKMARTAAETELQQWLTRRSNANLNSLFGADWSTKYAELFRRSGTIRDGREYHKQDFAEDAHWNTGPANKLSSMRWGSPVHHVKVVHGMYFQLGLPSRDVVDPNPH